MKDCIANRIYFRFKETKVHPFDVPDAIKRLLADGKVLFISVDKRDNKCDFVVTQRTKKALRRLFK